MLKVKLGIELIGNFTLNDIQKFCETYGLYAEFPANESLRIILTEVYY